MRAETDQELFYLILASRRNVALQDLAPRCSPLCAKLFTTSFFANRSIFPDLTELCLFTFLA